MERTFLNLETEPNPKEFQQHFSHPKNRFSVQRESLQKSGQTKLTFKWEASKTSRLFLKYEKRTLHLPQLVIRVNPINKGGTIFTRPYRFIRCWGVSGNGGQFEGGIKTSTSENKRRFTSVCNSKDVAIALNIFQARILRFPFEWKNSFSPAILVIRHFLEKFWCFKRLLVIVFIEKSF